MKDIDIRKITKNFLDFECCLDEINMGSSRIDCLFVKNSVWHGIEIKSDCDTLKRLSKQIKCYQYVCDKISVFITKKHFEKCLEMLPKTVGIYVVSENIVEIFREPEIDVSHRKLRLISGFLWREEAKQFLKENKIYSKLSKKSKYILCYTIQKNIDIENIKTYVIECFKKRYALGFYKEGRILNKN